MKVLEVNRAMLGYHNQCRQLISLLPSIKGVGFDALYLLPVVQKGEVNSVGSPYCIRDFWSLDPSFGNDEDWMELQQRCQDLQLEIWIDWVMNHTSWDHPWLTNHPDWYQRDAEREHINHPIGTNWTDVAQLNFHRATIDYFVEMAKKWMTIRGVKGFRCDAAYRIPANVWLQFFDGIADDSAKSVWLADQPIECFLDLGFNGFFSNGELQVEAFAWNKIYDHDRSAFGPYWNGQDEQRLKAMILDQYNLQNWLLGMGMMNPNQSVSFFENQEFDIQLWEAWMTQLSAIS
ncbi:MAG: hypothetical protein RL521_47 [Bacteroidota bacterium]